MLDGKDKARIRFQRVNEDTGKEVPYERIVRAFHMEGRYAVTVYDTWNMTEEDRGVYTDSFRIQLPGRPYMAIRLQKQ